MACSKNAWPFIKARVTGNGMPAAVIALLSNYTTVIAAGNIPSGVGGSRNQLFEEECVTFAFLSIGTGRRKMEVTGSENV